MDTTLDIRNKIHEFIETADDRILKIFSAIIATEEEEKGVSEQHRIILEARLKEHQKNPSSGKKWDVVKKSVKEKYGL